MMNNARNTVLIFVLLCLSSLYAQVNNAPGGEFQQFKKELGAYSALQRIINGHIVNPYWGINLFSNISLGNINTSFSDMEYKLMWSVENDPLNPKVKKGDGSQFKLDYTKYNPGDISFKVIGNKYLVVREVENGGKSALLTYTLHYYENNTSLSELDKNILSDTTLNIQSPVWYFIPALSYDLQQLKDTSKIIDDSSQHVKEMAALAKKMSLVIESQADTVDADQTYLCKYRIQQFFDHNMLCSDIFDNEKKSPHSGLTGYKIQKINLQLSPKRVKDGLTYLSDYRLNEHQTGFYPLGKYAIFYEHNLQYLQMGHWTLENICLCEVQSDH